MTVTYVPLLSVQRELQGIPRGIERFQQYLRTMLNEDRSDVVFPPLVIANPMARDHVTALLDALLAMDADGVAARTIAEAESQLSDIPGDLNVSLIVADDAKGGATNRYVYEFELRFGAARLQSRTATKQQRRPWATGVLWSSEVPSERAVREAMLTAACRVAYVHRHGPARTLRDMLAQEGSVMAAAGCAGPVLDAEDLAYTREVLATCLDNDDMPTSIECLFGDGAARSLGFIPRGLSPWAGLAVALHDERLHCQS
jgi:hypothetical protein